MASPRFRFDPRSSPTNFNILSLVTSPAVDAAVLALTESTAGSSFGPWLVGSHHGFEPFERQAIPLGHLNPLWGWHESEADDLVYPLATILEAAATSSWNDVEHGIARTALRSAFSVHGSRVRGSQVLEALVSMAAEEPLAEGVLTSLSPLRPGGRHFALFEGQPEVLPTQHAGALHFRPSDAVEWLAIAFHWLRQVDRHYRRQEHPGDFPVLVLNDPPFAYQPMHETDTNGMTDLLRFSRKLGAAVHVVLRPESIHLLSADSVHYFLCHCAWHLHAANVEVQNSPDGLGREYRQKRLRADKKSSPTSVMLDHADLGAFPLNTGMFLQHLAIH